jgi:hypothetical protein
VSAHCSCPRLVWLRACYFPWPRAFHKHHFTDAAAGAISNRQQQPGSGDCPALACRTSPATTRSHFMDTLTSFAAMNQFRNSTITMEAPSTLFRPAKRPRIGLACQRCKARKQRVRSCNSGVLRLPLSGYSVMAKSRLVLSVNEYQPDASMLRQLCRSPPSKGLMCKLSNAKSSSSKPSLGRLRTAYPCPPLQQGVLGKAMSFLAVRCHEQ